MSQPVSTLIGIELRLAMICADTNCATIFSPQPACPRCASPHFFPLSAWLDRKEKA